MQINHEEFIKLYDQNVAAIYRYIFLRVSSVEVAQDLTSEVFLRSWQKISLTISEGETAIIEKPKPFFYTIARNLVIDFYRHKPRKEISLETMEVQIPDLENDPASQTILDFEMEPIKQALDEIKEDYRDIVIWHYLDELSIPEIAGILGKSEGATRVMLSRGLKDLRKKISERTQRV